MAIDHKVRVLHAPYEHYAADFATVVEQREYKRRVVLQIRRIVRASEGEQLQIEITIETQHEKRTTSAHASFCCPPEIADIIAEACAKVRK